MRPIQLAMLGYAAAGAAFEATHAGYPRPRVEHFKQQLDHFSADTRTWDHRYFINSDAWDGRGMLENGCPGPILLYTGNEGPIDAFWNVSGFVVETLASALGGLVLFSEQRYYGNSLPFGDDSPTADQLQYLTTAQVVADHASVAEHIKHTTPGASSCPVVAFGGSYGGTLTALLRATFPNTVVGGIVASSELGYYDEAGWAAHGVDQLSFEKVVLATWTAARPKCLEAIQAAMAAIDDADLQEVVHAFGVCDAKVLGGGPPSAFLAYVLEGMPQGDYASAGRPVAAACDLLLEASSPGQLLQASGRVVQNFYGASSCIPFDGGGPGNTPGDGPGNASAWGYQSCTECLHAFSARGLRNFTFDLGESTQLCEALYDSNVKPDLHAISSTFGSAFAMAEGKPPKGHGSPVTNLVWSQGTLDPWHGWFRQMATPAAGLDIHHILIEGGAHHEDLRAPFAGDKPSVVQARLQEEAIIRRWIQQASAR